MCGGIDVLGSVCVASLGGLGDSLLFSGRTLFTTSGRGMLQYLNEF